MAGSNRFQMRVKPLSVAHFALPAQSRARRDPFRERLSLE